MRPHTSSLDFALWAAALIVLSLRPAAAQEWEREVRPGVTSFKRFTSGARPQRIFAVGVDLSVPNVGLHASADERYAEWSVNTLDFAEEVGAIAAINGDWSCASQSACGNSFLRPLGIAISRGMQWNPHRPTDDIGSTWGYLGCSIDKQCVLGRARPLNHPDMAFSPLQRPTIAPLRLHNAIGANGIVLLNDGERGNGCYDTGTDTPRSAACIQADGIHMWLVVVDGRGSGDGDTGMSCAEVRDLLLEPPFDCWDAVMLDGGGSSTLVVEDTNHVGSQCRGDLCVKNTPSDGSLRTVGNHLGIIYSDVIDSRCQVPNGKWCDGTVISTCNGGRFEGSGDCGAFGAGCQEDGNFAFCVDPRCPAGDGMGAGCTGATQIASCNDGAYGEGDCGFFGLVCGGPAGSAKCMDPRCTAGPDGAFCLSEGMRGACTDGIYAEEDCAALGQVCLAGTGSCGTPPVEDPMEGADAGVPGPGGEGEQEGGEGEGPSSEGEGEPGGDAPGNEDAQGDGSTDDGEQGTGADGDEPLAASVSSAACAAAPGSVSGAEPSLWSALVAWGALQRRRRASSRGSAHQGVGPGGSRPRSRWLRSLRAGWQRPSG